MTAPDDRDALARLIHSSTGFRAPRWETEHEGVRDRYLMQADAIIADGFRRAHPQPQTIVCTANLTDEERAILERCGAGGAGRVIEMTAKEPPPPQPQTTGGEVTEAALRRAIDAYNAAPVPLEANIMQAQSVQMRAAIGAVMDVANGNATAAHNYASGRITDAKGDGWISVKERMPERETRVNAWDGESVQPARYEAWGWGRDECSFARDDRGGFIEGVTHWRPLPPPPGQGARDGEGRT